MLFIPIPSCDYIARRSCRRESDRNDEPLAAAPLRFKRFLSLFYYTKRFPSRKEELRRARRPFKIPRKTYDFLYISFAGAYYARFFPVDDKIDKQGNLQR
jgi:hypothetical protein